MVGNLPAGAQIEPANVAQAPGDEEQAGVGDARAAAQLEDLQVGTVRGDPAQAVVRDVLAEAEVEAAQAGQVAIQRRVQRRVGEVVAAGEVEGGEGGQAGDKVAQGLAEAEHLDAPDPAARQRGEEGGVSAPQVKGGLAAPPDGLLVGRVAPTRADLT